METKVNNMKVVSFYRFIGLKNTNEVAVDKKSKKVIIKIKKDLFRPIEIKSTFGNSSKARKVLKWKPKTDFNSLVKIMCDTELKKNS